MLVNNKKLPFPFEATGHSVSVALQQAPKLVRKTVGGKEMVHALPPSLGQFEFFMHNGKKIVPIDATNALWLSFTLDTQGLDVPYAIKILAGGVNAVTGETEHGADVLRLRNNVPGTKTGQNYMLLPAQPWIDGFKTADGTVRQFVAEILGEGKSVEEILDGTEHGGLQIIVIPPTAAVIQEAIRASETIRRPKGFSKGRRSGGIIHSSMPKYGPIGDTGICKGGAEEPEEPEVMGLAAGAQIKQSINFSTVPVDAFDPHDARVLNLTILEAGAFRTLRGLPNPPRMPTQAEYDKLSGLYFDLPVPAAHAVKADPMSRLVQQQEALADAVLPKLEAKDPIFGGWSCDPCAGAAKPLWYGVQPPTIVTLPVSTSAQTNNAADKNKTPAPTW